MNITEDTGWMRVPEDYDDQVMIDEFEGLKWVRFWTESRRDGEDYLFDVIFEGEEDPDTKASLLDQAEALIQKALELKSVEDHADSLDELCERLISTFGMEGWA